MIDYKEIRHALHEHPQTADCEEYAHDTIVKHLQGLHPDKVYTHVGGYGVIAVWQSQNSRNHAIEQSCIPTIAFRADTDALPIGHRCGHDGHTTILLRLAELIDGLTPQPPLLERGGENNVSNSPRLTGEGLGVRPNVLLLWQPAEETGTGSRAVLDTGILQQYNITAFYALHNLPGYPLGTVVLCPHTFAAASTGVVYHLDGRETHASTPELGVNPGLAVAEIINRFSGFNEHSLNQSSIQTFKQSTLI
ncbi:MAG: amidohydrolase, partial [Bacteroidales bacterium]|nr:amidohydrolase [Bacteroidales bacterium]